MCKTISFKTVSVIIRWRRCWYTTWVYKLVLSNVCRVMWWKYPVQLLYARVVCVVSMPMWSVFYRGSPCFCYKCYNDLLYPFTLASKNGERLWALLSIFFIENRNRNGKQLKWLNGTHKIRPYDVRKLKTKQCAR